MNKLHERGLVYESYYTTGSCVRHRENRSQPFVTIRDELIVTLVATGC